MSQSNTVIANGVEWEYQPDQAAWTNDKGQWLPYKPVDGVDEMETLRDEITALKDENAQLKKALAEAGAVAESESRLRRQLQGAKDREGLFDSCITDHIRSSSSAKGRRQ